MSETLIAQVEGDREVWKDIPGFKGVYQVSNLGRIKSLKRTCGEGKRKRTVPERIIAITPHVRHGRVEFASVRLNNPKGGGKQVSIGRLVLSVFKGRAPRGAIAMTRDGNPMNARLSNLFWGTFTKAAEASRVRQQDGSLRSTQSLSKEDARSALAQEAQKAYRVELGLDVAITYQGGWYQVTSPSGDVIQRARKVQLERRLASLRAAA